jgi:two-component system, NarL family, nitrate/nitrite response regulator NarL
MTNTISCLVADDHPAMVEAICAVLEDHDISVAGRAHDGAEAYTKIEKRRPTVALVDVRMPSLSGLDLVRHAAKANLPTRIILYTGYGDRTLLTEAIDAGASGFLMKAAPLLHLVRAVEIVARGGTYVDPVLADVLAVSKGNGNTPELTPREREVLRLLADGFANEEIGRQLVISPETVRTHVRKAMTKLGAETRTQAVAKALRLSLIA